MKCIYAILFLAACNTQTMEDGNTFQLVCDSNPSRGFKELKYQLTHHPIGYASYAALVTAGSWLAWKMHPNACIGFNLLSTTPSLVSFAYLLPKQATMRMNSHKRMMLIAVIKGEFAELQTLSSKTCYEETDVQSLKQQNTEFLLCVLEQYNKFLNYGNQEEALKYSRAATIELQNHADAHLVKKILDDSPFTKASEWLKANANQS